MSRKRIIQIREYEREERRRGCKEVARDILLLITDHGFSDIRLKLTQEL